MKLEMLFTGIMLVGTTLLVRVQIQGVEAALLSMAVERGMRVVRAGSTIVRKVAHCVG